MKKESMTTSNYLKRQDYSGAFAIMDPDTVSLLDKQSAISYREINHNKDIIPDFLNAYEDWIKAPGSNTIIGLDDFKYKVFSAGTTEAFDKFYIKHHTKHFRIFKGEYVYHKLAFRSNYSWSWLDDDPIGPNDAVIISLPFSDTGNEHSRHTEILEECERLNVPVLIDCVYFGTCQDITFDFSYKCITDVVFSLSKAFPLAYARIGIRFTRENDDDLMFVYNGMQYNNKIGAIIGHEFLKSFSNNYIPSKYRSTQIELCNLLEVEPSNTVLFGIGGEEWSKYNRGGPTNRLSVFKQFLEYLGLETRVSIE